LKQHKKNNENDLPGLLEQQSYKAANRVLKITQGLISAQD